MEVGNRGSGSSAPAAFEIVMMSFGGCGLEEEPFVGQGESLHGFALVAGAVEKKYRHRKL